MIVLTRLDNRGVMVLDVETKKDTNVGSGSVVRGFLRQADLDLGMILNWYMLLVFPLDGTLRCSVNSLWAV